jgi:hypothetical protein
MGHSHASYRHIDQKFCPLQGLLEVESLLAMILFAIFCTDYSHLRTLGRIKRDGA